MQHDSFTESQFPNSYCDFNRTSGADPSYFHGSPAPTGNKFLTTPPTNPYPSEPSTAVYSEIGMKDLLRPPAINIGAIREELEGPKPLRAIATVCGLAMTVAACLNLLSIERALKHPCEYMVEVQMAIFGLSVVVMESKSIAATDVKRKTWLHKWFPFTTIVGGKGLTYIFFGTLGMSFGLDEVFNFGTGAALALMGAVYCTIQFTKNETLAQKYDESVVYSHAPK